MRHSRRGFTLLETLVALAIMTIALTAAFRAMGVAAQTSGDLREHLIGNWVAENRFAELRATQAWPEPGTQEGDATQAGQTYHWRQETVSTANSMVRRINLSVYGPGSGEHAITRLSGFVARPLR